MNKFVAVNKFVGGSLQVVAHVHATKLDNGLVALAFNAVLNEQELALLQEWIEGQYVKHPDPGVDLHRFQFILIRAQFLEDITKLNLPNKEA